MLYRRGFSSGLNGAGCLHRVKAGMNRVSACDSLNYQRAIRIRDRSLLFVSLHHQDPVSVRQRGSGDDVADLPSTESRPDSYYRTTTTVASLNEKSNSFGENALNQHRTIGILFLSHRFDEILNYAPFLRSSTGFQSFLEFIASIGDPATTSESKAARAIEHSYFARESLPQFYHIMDELQILQGCGHASLLKLLTRDLQVFKERFLKRPRLIPVPTHNFMNLSISHKEVDGSIEEQLWNQREDIKWSMDEVVPMAQDISQIHLSSFLPEPNEGGLLNHSQTNQEKVIKCAAYGDWWTAVLYATQEIEANPNDHQMLLRRSYALYKIGMINNAIADCTASLKLHKSREAYRLLAAFWALLGQSSITLKNITLSDALEEGEKKE